MSTQYSGFRATTPVARLIDELKTIYEVFFIVYDQNKKIHRLRYSKGINSEHPKNRQIAAKALAESFTEALKDGWNPLVHKYPMFEKERIAIKQYTFSAALDFALGKKKPHLSEFSYPDYRGCVKFIKKAAAECGCLNTLINQVRRRDIRMIIATAKEQRSWTSKARNKYLDILKSLLSVLVDEEIVEHSPALKIKNELQEKTIGFKRLTDDEKQTISDRLMLVAPDYFEYLMFIYHPGIRRKENLLIKVKDINLQKREIRIRPEVAKTNTERIVAIADDIYTILMNREVWKLHKEWYIFSSNKFKPGPEHYHPNTPTNWWRTLVQQGLGIDCKMYSLKHKGADDKIMNGVDIRALKEQYGHKSLQMTEIYADAVKQQYSQQIIAGSKPFAKVVEMKRKAN